MVSFILLPQTVILLVPCGLYLTLVVLWKLARLYVYNNNTGIPDLKRFNTPRKRIRGTVVVCGGSISGLLTARVCSDSFEKVVIVEPEAWLATEEGMGLHGWEQNATRSRVMQYKSIHGNQALLFRGLSELFPNFLDQCNASNIRILPGDFKVTFAGTPFRVPSASFGGKIPDTMFCCRRGLETLIRRLTLSKGSYNNITQIAGVVTGIIPDSSNPLRICQVSVRNPDGFFHRLDATLVIDCTGPSRAGLKWLKSARYGHSLVDRIRVALDQKLHYSTMCFTIPPELRQRLPIPGGFDSAGAVYTFIEDRPELGRRFFAITKPDGDRLTICSGQSSDISPNIKTLEDLIEYKDSLITFRDPIPTWVHEMIEMLKEIEHNDDKVCSQVRVPGASYLRYHLATNLPSNFIAVGDSVMSVDPTFAQGCTKALLGVVSLNNTFLTLNPETTLPDDFSIKFFKEQAKKIDNLWKMTRFMDYAIPYTVPIPGERLSSGYLVRIYIRRMQILGIHDEQAAVAIFNGAHGLGTALDAFHPWLVVKVLWDMVRRPWL